MVATIDTLSTMQTEMLRARLETTGVLRDTHAGLARDYAALVEAIRAELARRETLEAWAATRQAWEEA